MFMKVNSQIHTFQHYSIKLYIYTVIAYILNSQIMYSRLFTFWSKTEVCAGQGIEEVFSLFNIGIVSVLAAVSAATFPNTNHIVRRYCHNV